MTLTIELRTGPVVVIGQSLGGAVGLPCWPATIPRRLGTCCFDPTPVNDVKLARAGGADGADGRATVHGCRAADAAAGRGRSDDRSASSDAAT